MWNLTTTKKNTLTNKRKGEQTHRYRDQVTGYQRERGWVQVKIGIGGKLYGDEWKLDLWWWSPGATYRCQIKILYVLCSVTKLARRFVTLWTVAHQAPLSMGFPGKNTGEGCHFLLQGTVLTQGSNLGLSRLLHRRWILCHWAIRKASWCCISKTCKWWE